jgi:hypothetical protein
MRAQFGHTQHPRGSRLARADVRTVLGQRAPLSKAVDG